MSAIGRLLATRVTVGSLEVDGGDLLAVVPLAASLAAGLLVFPLLPAEMAVHFSGGAPDQYMARSAAVWLVPAVGLAALAVVRHRGTYAGPFRVVLSGFVGWVVALAHGYVLAWNLGVRVSSLVVLVPALGGGLLLGVLQRTRFGS